MELTFFTWVLRESIAVNQVNDTNTCQGLKSLSFIEWEQLVYIYLFLVVVQAAL